MAQRGRAIPNRAVIKGPCVNRAPFRYAYTMRPLAATWSKRFPVSRAFFGQAMMPFSRAICGAATAYSAYGDIAVIEPTYSGGATAYSAYTGLAELECCGC